MPKFDSISFPIFLAISKLMVFSCNPPYPIAPASFPPCPASITIVSNNQRLRIALIFAAFSATAVRSKIEILFSYVSISKSSILDFKRKEIWADSSDCIVRIRTTGFINGGSTSLNESTIPPAMVTFSQPPLVIDAAITFLVKSLRVLIMITVPLTLLIIEVP